MDIQPYTIRHGKGGNTVLVCCHCDYGVRTKDFDPSNGNVRTQAATTIIAHQASEHRRPVLTWATQSVGAERLWTR